MLRSIDDRWAYAALTGIAAGLLVAVFFGVSSSRGGRDAAIGVAFAAVALFVDRLLDAARDRRVSSTLDGKLDEIISVLERIEGERRDESGE